MVNCSLRVLRFVDFHLFDHRTALGVGFRQFLQMAVEMRLDLTLGFGEEAEVPFVAQQSGDDAHAANRYERMINIKDRGQIFRVDVDTIESVEAAGDYMCIKTGDNTLILRETMKDLEKRLDPRRFQRVHRSTIVNLDQVRQVRPHTNGECFLVLDSGSQVKVSRSYRDVVARFVH